MRTVIEIESATADRLRELADSKSISIDELLAEHFSGSPGKQGKRDESDADKVKEFEKWAQGFPENKNLLSDEEIGRASIYPDR